MAVQRFDLDPDRSQVWIDGSSSVHPIRATASGLEGGLALDLVQAGPAARPRLEGQVRIAVDRLRSGNPLVDAETRRRIDARRHPEIVGIVRSSAREATDVLVLEGEIAFRGVVQPVSGRLHVERLGDELHVWGEQRFDVRAWGLQPPKVALVRVHPEITVRLDAWAVPS